MAWYNLLELEMDQAGNEAWAAVLSIMPGEERMEPGALWLHDFEQELWLLEAELFAEYNELQKHTETWYAEVNGLK